MSERCTAISIVVCFLIFIVVVYFIPDWLRSLNFGPSIDNDRPTLTLFRRPSPNHPEFDKVKVQCNLSDAGVKSPLLESFIQASATDEVQELHLRGLAVTSNLKDACQPLNDVSKAKIQVNKIALVTLESETVSCPLQDLAVHAQNAGYSGLIYFKKANQRITVGSTQVTSEDKLLIPVIISERKCKDVDNIDDDASFFVDDSFLVTADQTNVEIRMPVLQPPSEELGKMKKYLNHLYYWFLVGPIITFGWIIGKKKLCSLSGCQKVNDREDQVAANETTVESEIRTVEEGENKTEESQQRHGEEQLLLTSVNNNPVRRPRGTQCVDSVRKFLNKAVECFGYLILIIAALPVVISSGRLSFFRFDEGYSISDSIWFPADWPIPLFAGCWSPLQIFCFFMYSRFTCKTKWTVPTKFLKLIRSDWFASNIYLLVLGVVLPFCSFSNTASRLFSYFAIYNTLCTLCNVLFLIILNKHKVVTPYVFYISVCMVCAYIKSDIVALFYFALNSQGSLNNFKLTALRTAAIGLTLVVSFRTSMHIIRKLNTPRQSLFEGLGEQ